jgi:hypothetical protein
MPFAPLALTGFLDRACVYRIEADPRLLSQATYEAVMIVPIFPDHDNNGSGHTAVKNDEPVDHWWALRSPASGTAAAPKCA